MSVTSRTQSPIIPMGGRTVGNSSCLFLFDFTAGQLELAVIKCEMIGQCVLTANNGLAGVFWDP